MPPKPPRISQEPTFEGGVHRFVGPTTFRQGGAKDVGLTEMGQMA